MPASDGPSLRKPQSSRHLPALKAPTHASPGQRPGYRNPSIVVRPERAQGRPSAISGRTIFLCILPGVLPRAGMLRAVGATTCPCFRLDKTDGVTRPLKITRVRLRKSSVSLA
jgi:hypothetical protein